MRSTRAYEPPAVRRLWLAVSVTAAALCACGDGDDSGSADSGVLVDSGAPDGARADAFIPIDAQPRRCSADAMSATINAVTPLGTFSFDRAFAGGVLLAGPVAPPAGDGGVDIPFDLVLYVATVDEVDAQQLESCEFSGDPDACDFGPLASIRARIEPGDELGVHDASVRIQADGTWSADGTITVTTMDDPFANNGPGITGSIAVTDAGSTLTGFFDADFCAYLLSVTI